MASQYVITMNSVILPCIPNGDMLCMLDTSVNMSSLSLINIMKSLADIKLLWDALNPVKLP